MVRTTVNVSAVCRNISSSHYILVTWLNIHRFYTTGSRTVSGPLWSSLSQQTLVVANTVGTCLTHTHTHTHTHTLYFHSTVHRRPSEVMNCVKNPSVLHFQFGRISAALLMIFPNTFVCSVIRSVASLTPHNILICGVPWLDLEWSRMWCNISTSRTFRSHFPTRWLIWETMK